MDNQFDGNNSIDDVSENTPELVDEITPESFDEMETLEEEKIAGIVFATPPAKETQEVDPITERYKNAHKRYIEKSRFSAAFIPAILFIVLTFVVSIAINIGFFADNDSEYISPVDSLLITMATMVIAHILTIIFTSKILKQKIFAPITSKPKKPKKAFLTVLFALGVGGLASIVVTPLYHLFPGGNNFEVYFERPETTILVFILVAIIPPLFEEWLIRGMVLKHLLPFGKWTAIIVSSVIFGMLHSHPGKAIFAFTFGIFLGIIYVNSGGNIWLVFIVHFINNAISVIQNYLMVNQIDTWFGDFTTILLSYVPIIIATIILLSLVLKNKKGFFLPEDGVEHIIKQDEGKKTKIGVSEFDYENYDINPKGATKLIFASSSTYIYIVLSIAMMVITTAQGISG